MMTEVFHVAYVKGCKCAFCARTIELDGKLNGSVDAQQELRQIAKATTRREIKKQKNLANLAKGGFVIDMRASGFIARNDPEVMGG